MSLSHLAVDDAGPILFAMDSNTSPSHSPSMTTSPTKAPHSPPPLPKRNARRASRFLDALLDSSAPTTATTPTTVTATTTSTTATVTTAKDKSSPKMTSSTHEIYLSSEEDASSLGDVSDYEDAEEYDYDSDTVEYMGAPVAVQIPVTATPASLPTTTKDDSGRRHSHEDKARLISVVYAGKPSLVDLAVERAARRRSLSARSNRSDSSASRSSTSAGSGPGSGPGSAPSTALSSANASPQRLHHKRNSSGSMLASLRYRKAMETIADSPVVSKNREADMPKPMRSYTTSTSASTSRMPPLNTAIIAATAAANAASSAASPLSSSPRTPTFAHGNLLRGVTRSLTLNRRGSRLLNKERDAAVATSQAPSSAAVPSLPGQLPGVAPASSDISSLRRKSLALSVVSLGLGGDKTDRSDKTAPLVPQTPDEHMFTTSIAPALRRASTTGAFLSSTPSHRVLSKKNNTGSNTASSPSSSFFSRRRSVKLL